MDEEAADGEGGFGFDRFESGGKVAGTTEQERKGVVVIRRDKLVGELEQVVDALFGKGCSGGIVAAESCIGEALLKGRGDIGIGDTDSDESGGGAQRGHKIATKIGLGSGIGALVNDPIGMRNGNFPRQPGVGEGASAGVKQGGFRLGGMHEYRRGDCLGVADEGAPGEGFQIGHGGDDEMADAIGERPERSGAAGGGTGIEETTFFREGDGAGFDLGEFVPATGLPILACQDFGRFAEVEVGLDEEAANSQEFRGVVVGPFELAFHRIDRKDASISGERQVEEESGPDELCR